MLKSYRAGGWWWWPTGFYCQPQGPLGFGLGDFGAEGLGPGLDNKKIAHCQDLILSQTFYQIDSIKIMTFSY